MTQHNITYLQQHPGAELQLEIKWTGDRYLVVLYHHGVSEPFPGLVVPTDQGEPVIVAEKPAGAFRSAVLRKLADEHLALLERGEYLKHLL